MPVLFKAIYTPQLKLFNGQLYITNTSHFPNHTKTKFVQNISNFASPCSSAADSAAKDALDGDISVELIPFSDLKPRTNKYILELWQSEWDEFPENKLYKIYSNTKRMYCLSPEKQKRRDCDGSIAHWPFFYYSFLFIEG